MNENIRRRNNCVGTNTWKKARKKNTDQGYWGVWKKKSENIERIENNGARKKIVEEMGERINLSQNRHPLYHKYKRK